MTISVGKSSAYKAVNALWVGKSGAWKSVRQGWVGAGGAWKLFYTAFTPVTNTHNSGSGNETVPTNASQCVITVNAAGGGATWNFNGGKGGKSVKTISISESDWGKTLAYSVGAHGTGAIIFTGASNGGSSTVSSSTLAVGSISITANGGSRATNSADGADGTASGGDTNTTGGGAAGGSSSDDNATPGSNGSDGSISFAWA